MSLDGPHAVLVLGGIRSGKSEYAESLVADAPDVRYVATGPAPDPAQDPEWAQRVAAHLDRRPAGWTAEETAGDPGRLVALLAEAKPEETVLVDDLGGWLTAVLADTGWSAGPARGPVAALVDAVRGCVARLVVVSPEVGLSVVPGTDSGQAFADAMGAANRALAGVVAGVVLVVAGQPVWLKRAAVTAAAARPAPAPAPVTAGDLAITPGMDLPLPDEAAAVAATERLRLLDLPGSGLGGLGRLVSFVAGVQGTETPRPFEAVRVLLVYGAHEGGVAAGDAAVDWQRRLDQAHHGEGPLSLLAARAGASVHTLDTVTAEGLGAAAAIEAGDAMPLSDVDEAVRYGWRTVDKLVEDGTDLLVLAAAGPGQEAVASALAASTTTREPAALLGRVLVPGGAIDDNAWMIRCGAVRDGLHRMRGGTRDARKLLAALGGPDFAVAVGILLGAAASRVPVVLDGPVGIAAALVARELATQVRLWALVLDDGGHPTVRAGVDVLSVAPLVTLGLGLGEGTNALAALPLVQAALVLSTLDTVPPAAGPDVA
ncbi:MAG: nicotinate-nucleotide--dimethylbenzimidazole phosphoribosyltransferase [Micromonosporaceae bacterium]